MGLCTKYDDKWGEGVAQMSTLLNNSYVFVKMSMKMKGVKIAPNFIYVVYTTPKCFLVFSRQDQNIKTFAI